MSSPGSRLRAALDRWTLLAIAVAVAAAIGIYLGVDAWIGGRAVIKITGVGPRPIELLDPRWLATIHDHMTLREIDLYAVVQRSFGVSGDDAEALPHEWPRRFMRGRKARIETGQPYVDFDFSAFADYL